MRHLVAIAAAAFAVCGGAHGRGIAADLDRLESAISALSVSSPGAPGGPCLRGKAGTCGKPSACETSVVRGFCRGGTDNVCCVTPGGSTTGGGGGGGGNGPRCVRAGGSCGSRGGCEGTVRSGLCPGGADNVCCVPSSSTTSSSTAHTEEEEEEESIAAEEAEARREGLGGPTEAEKEEEEEERVVDGAADDAERASAESHPTSSASEEESTGDYTETSPGSAVTGRFKSRCQAYGHCVSSSRGTGQPAHRVYRAGGPNDRRKKLMCPTPSEYCVVEPYAERQRCSGFGFDLGTCASSCPSGTTAVSGLCPRASGESCCVRRSPESPAPLRCPIGDPGQEIVFGNGAAMHFDSRSCGAMRCSNPHLGIDLKLKRGGADGLYAMGDGRVWYAYDECGAPRNRGEAITTIGVEYDAAPGRIAIYRHVKEATIEPRRPDRRAFRDGTRPAAYEEFQRVTKGQRIATMGGTCTPGGPHLHFEFRELHLGDDERTRYYRNSNLKSQWMVDPEPLLRGMSDCVFVERR